MSASAIVATSSHPAFLDDEIFALALQLEELEVHSQSGKGKHAINNPPDIDVAFASFQAELEDYKVFLTDHRLAESMGNAVHTDGALITNIMSQDVQFHEDRNTAIQLSNNDPDIEDPPRSIRQELGSGIQDWLSTVSGTLAATSIVDFSDDDGDNETKAGPSMSYAERQVDLLGKLSTRFQCTACMDRFPIARMITAKCSHRYCDKCMKELFMRSTKDEGLYPPRCCKQPIPLQIVAEFLSGDELSAFQLASIEFATVDKVYCSNKLCRTFIPPDHISVGLDRATCRKCGHHTCSLCNNTYHTGTDCPDDAALRETRELAKSMEWQTCYRCNRVVDLRSGCNHITCHCRAQFCYVCGLKWKSCKCPTADINRIVERAQEVVNRDAPDDLPNAEHRRRVQEVQAQLEEDHECVHPGRFQRVFGRRRGGAMECEMCGAYHYKYLLQCRRCFINVCEECRRNRV
ncbi:hypothetical protein K504DRAFT_444366 [Pleomassaria siparia CBS 279.74]|uniref:RBR-type E3 ubiquitin transferase n=1 Tax=Pleomassaria siparia CBS 279.74 TaxID=1314801 RepID=A0A6G1JRG5_9PLEO|nr:hypothetical protein K504DRAFT_444366 [Pleomassaria siparia CBS 279.74]